MHVNHDYVALDWVKDEIEATLKQAQLALEAFSENPQDITRMRFCLTYLHQVHGTLQMVEFFGASLLAEEMEMLAQAILNQETQDTEAAQEALVRATFQLPAYLDRIRLGRKDMPIIVLPLLNELRSARGENSLSETSIFNPDIESGNEAFFNRPNAVETPHETISLRQLRQLFQLAYASLLRNKDTEAQFAKMSKVINLLEKEAQHSNSAQLWWVAGAVIECVSHSTTENNDAIKPLLGILDKHLKAAVESDGQSFQTEIDKQELKRFLLFIAQSSAKTTLIEEVKAAYNLNGMLLTNDLLTQEQHPLTGIDRAALQSATSALMEELNEIKDALDIYIRSKDRNADALQNLAANLKHSSDTLALLGLGSQRKILTDQITTLKWCSEHTQDGAVDDKLLDVAGALIYVESSLSGQDLGLEAGQNEGHLPKVSPQHINQAQGALIRECQAGLETAKDHIVDFIVSQWETSHLQNVPAIFDEVSGGLNIIQQKRASTLVSHCSHYVKERLLSEGEGAPNWKTMDTLADAISSIECYLERLVDDNHTDDYILDIAESSLSSMGYSIESTEEESADKNQHNSAAIIDSDSAPEDAIAEDIPLDAEITSLGAPLDDTQLDLGNDLSNFDIPPLDSDLFTPASPVDASADFNFETQEVEETESLSASHDEDELESESHQEEAIPSDIENESVVESSGTIESSEQPEQEDDLIDDEIIEIFVEESGEVLETINNYLPVWKANWEDNEALTEIRRAFHTLKGSGRLVGAIEAGELAWGVENMLNRLLEKTISVSDDMINIIEQVTSMIPAYVTAFEQRTSAPTGGESVIEQANLIAEGKAITTADQVEESIADNTFVLDTPEEAGLEPEAEFEPEAELEPEADIVLGPEAELEPESVFELDSLDESFDHETLSEELAAEESDFSENLPEQTDIAEFSAASEQDSEVEFDETLIEIFTGEAESHLQTVHAFLKDHPVGAAPVKVSGDVLRALHTLKGSAHMANMSSFADIASPVEQLVKQVANIDYMLHEDLLTLLFNATKVLDEKVKHIKTHSEAEVVEGENALFNEIKQLEEKYQQQQTEHSNKVCDQNFINIFLAEEMDIILEAASHLTNWEQTPHSHDIAGQLEKEVMAIAHHAASAKIPEIERLCNKLAECYQAAQAHQLSTDEIFFETARQAHDSLIELMDKLAAHQPIDATSEMEEKLDNLLLAVDSAASENAQEPSAIALGQFEPESFELKTQEETAESELEQRESDNAEILELNDALEPAALEEVEDVLAPEEAIEETITEDTEVAEDKARNETALELELDPELVEIFLEEADEILESLSGNLERWASDTSNTGEIEQLQRSLHTLKGGARMAGLKPIGDLSHELETLYELSTNGELAYSEEMGELLIQCHDSLGDMVDDIKTNIAPQEASALIEQIIAFSKQTGSESPAEMEAASLEGVISPNNVTPITAAQAPETDEELVIDTSDVEVMALFVEEARELLEAIENSIEQWQATPDSDAQQEELKRLLHTLKGSARLAGLSHLGDLSHSFESDIVDLEAQPETDNDALFQNLKGQYDGLTTWVEKLAAQLATQQNLAQEDRTKELAEQTAEMARKAHAAKEKPSNKAEEQQEAAKAATQEMIRVSSELLENLVNLAGETSINRAQVEKEVTDFTYTLDEIGDTIERLQEQMRRLNMETEAQIVFSHEAQVQEESNEYEDFDPLEMDRYSLIHQLSRSLSESTHDLTDLKDTLTNKARDTETLLLQQSRINTELQEGLMRTRLVPFSRLAPRLRRMIRQVGQELGKPVELEIVNAEGEMDRAVLDRLVSPLEHMLRNSLDHGIEPPEERKKLGKNKKGKITLHISREGAEVVLRLSDDGAGIDSNKVRAKAIERKLLDGQAELTDTEILQFIFKPGFSTAEKVTQISGRGVGMDVVNSEIKQLGGSTRIHSSPGAGTQFTIRLPFTVSVNRALMVKVGEDTYAIPLSHIEGIVRVSPYELETYYQPDNENAFQYAERDYDLQYLGAYVKDIPSPILTGQTQPLPVILVRGTDKPMAFQVDSLIGSREVVVKSLGPQLSSVTGLSGATILGDGNVVIILDLISMIRSDWAQRLYGESHRETEVHEKTGNEIPTVMVVDDSVTVRKITSRLLERNGYQVVLAKDGMDAISILQDHTPDVMLLDIEMPRMDGFEVASIVKHEERLKDISIIMITSRTGQKHRERAMSLGVNEYLGKPFQEAELLKHIEKYISADVSV